MTVIKKGGIEALIRKPDPRLRAALVHGPDRSAVSEVAGALLRRLTPDPDDPFTVELLGESDIDPERLAESLSALSLTGSRRIVRLRVTGELGSKERVVESALTSHLDDALGSDAIFLIECGALDKRSSLRKTAEAADLAAAVILYEDESADMGRLARDILSRADVRCSAPVLETLAQRLPRDRGVARQTLEALMLYLGAGAASMSMEDLDQALPVDRVGPSTDVASSAFSGDVERTVGALARARFVGESGPAIVRSLASHRSRLARAKAAIEGGASLPAAVKAAGVFWKDERDFSEQVGRWRKPHLDELQAELLSADAACKTAGAPDELIAHHCALAIARRAAGAL